MASTDLSQIESEIDQYKDEIWAIRKEKLFGSKYEK